MAANEVVVTGIGLVTPLGVGRAVNWRRLCAGESAAGPLRRFDASAFAVQIACELDDQGAAEALLGRRFCRSSDPFVHYALLAADEAWHDAGLETPTEAERERCGVYLGVAFGGLSSFEESHSVLLTQGPRRVSPYFIPSVLPNMAAGQVAIRLGLHGPAMAPVSACASGAHAIGEGLRCIARGEADLMLCGGAEAPITPAVVAGFCAMKAMSRRNDEPARASRPFDADRDGFVIGEGAAIVVLERADRARARGARIYAKLEGFGNTNDAHHITTPAPEGVGAARCMEAALRDAGWSAERVEHINAHGTSTRLNDLSETQAIKRVLGERAWQVPVTANKSMIGHAMGAAGAIEAAVTVLTIAQELIPPTINLDTADPACDLDYVPKEARHAAVAAALCNSFGFGGGNVCLAFAR